MCDLPVQQEEATPAVPAGTASAGVGVQPAAAPEGSTRPGTVAAWSPSGVAQRGVSDTHSTSSPPPPEAAQQTQRQRLPHLVQQQQQQQQFPSQQGTAGSDQRWLASMAATASAAAAATVAPATAALPTLLGSAAAAAPDDLWWLSNTLQETTMHTQFTQACSAIRACSKCTWMIMWAAVLLPRTLPCTAC